MLKTNALACGGFRKLRLAAAVAAAFAFAPAAQAWSHQGHIIITRLAALRIINDPAAPAGLRDFLKINMPFDMSACKKLALEETVGKTAENYLSGLDGACTLPDRIAVTAEGKKDIEPYGAPEAKMHFMDMEWLGKDPTYKPDLSNRPKIAAISRDLHDPRWKAAGFVPFRVEECYKKTVAAFGVGEKVADNALALHWVGYLCHYIEDCHQPLHATVDFRSYSYLAGKIKQVHEIKTITSDGQTAVSYRCDDFQNIDPHGDLEFRLFDNDEEPLKSLRVEYWNELTARIDAGAKAERLGGHPTAPAGSFTRALEILSDSYDYLPAVGKAAQAGYANGGVFDAQAFFTSADTVHGEKMDTVQLIAQRNADAVLEVERTLRQAWAQAHPAPGR